MCACCWPPARPVCLNNELVDFQPQTVTGSDLHYIANSYTMFLSPQPTFSNRVLDQM